ncbi:putative Rac prophage; prophage lambda endopeptidase [Xenorhabdus poinarii G6]|uniref:Putative Rac prophage prophage lambda endopeptidase n=1 Tax=Xenorhabdus poinarii G6 TaxID=1354304 RepID=A0A068R0F6_9GAMM|nr:lysis protein [Xenorhabdus poinarii]CDG20673.1 putative Rac prophage; prophage lambda endopeptidase [Xenorhabdus poinarii G6]
MKFTLPHYMAIILIIVTVASVFETYYHGVKRAELQEVNERQKTEIQQLTDRITYQNTHITMLHELDTKHTQELAHAKSEINNLRADVAAGRRKLRIKANCPVSEPPASSSVVDATTVELSGATGSTVLDIRENIINDLAKLKYLQDYIKTECSL